jgi:hypothetical protein
MTKDVTGRVCGKNGGEEMHTGFWWGKVREIDHLEDAGIDEKVIIKWILIKSIGKTWTGLIWLGIRTIGELLCMG